MALPDSIVPMSETEGDWIQSTDLLVRKDNRVTIPKGAHERYGVDEGDLIEVTVVVRGDPDVEIPLGIRRVISHRRVTIPDHQVDKHDLVGQYVDIRYRMADGDRDP